MLGSHVRPTEGGRKGRQAVRLGAGSRESPRKEAPSLVVGEYGAICLACQGKTGHNICGLKIGLWRIEFR